MWARDMNPRPKLGKLILKREKTHELAAFLRFSMFLKWIPIGAASGDSERCSYPYDLNLQPADFSRCVAVLILMAFSCVLPSVIRVVWVGFVLNLFSAGEVTP